MFTGETCQSNEYCDEGTREQNNRLLFFLLTTASSVLLFTLGYYYIDNKRQDGKLVGMVNSLQRDLLCTSKVSIMNYYFISYNNQPGFA